MNVIEIIVDSVEGSNEGFESAEEGFGGIGKAAKAGMVVAAAALAGVGVAAAALSDQLFKAMDIEAGNDKMAAQLGLMPKAAESYGRIAGELYSGAYGEGLEDVNDALVAVQRNMAGMADASEADLKSVTATAMDFAAVFDTDVTEATRAAGIMIRNGLAKDATEAFDLLTVGMQSGADAGEDLLDTFDEYSPLFAKLGLSGTQAMGMISQSMRAGARDSDFAADAIKEFSIRAIDGSKGTVDAFTSLGMNADKMRATFAKGGPESAAALDLVMDKLRAMTDPAKQAEVATQLFGTKAEDLAATLLAMDPSAAVESMGEVAGAAEHMSTVLADNAKTKLESFKRTLETNVSNFIGQVVLPKVVELAEQAGPKLAEFGASARDAFTWITGKPEALAALGAVVGVVLVAAFGALAVSAWSAAAGVIAATWPILAIAAAVAGLAALMVYLYNNWDTFRSVVDTVVGFIQSNAIPVFETIKATVISFYETALVPLIAYIQSNSEQFANIGKVLLVVAGIIVGVVVGALALMVLGGMAVTAMAALVILILVALIAKIYDVVQTLWNWFNTARDVAGGVIDNVEEIMQIFWDLANNVGTAIANVIRAIWNVVQTVWDMAQNIGSAIADGVRWFDSLPGKILSAIGDLGGLLLNVGRSIIDGLVRGIEGGIQKVKDILGKVTGLIPDWKGPAERDAHLLEPAGDSIMGSLMSGIAGRLPDLRRQLGAISDTIPGTIDVAGGPGAGGVAGIGGGPGWGGNVYVTVYGSILSERDVKSIVRDAISSGGFRP